MGRRWPCVQCRLLSCSGTAGCSALSCPAAAAEQRARLARRHSFCAHTHTDHPALHLQQSSTCSLAEWACAAIQHALPCTYGHRQPRAAPHTVRALLCLHMHILQCMHQLAHACKCCSVHALPCTPCTKACSAVRMLANTAVCTRCNKTCPAVYTPVQILQCAHPAIKHALQ